MSSQNSNGKKAHEKIPQASPTDVQGRKRMNENGDDEEHNDIPPFLRSEEGSDSGSGSAGGLDASMNEGEGDGKSSDLTKTSEDVAQEEKGEDNQAQEQEESQENSKDRSSQAKSVIEESGDTAQGQENSQDDGEVTQENQNQDQDDDPEKITSSEQDENDESMPEDRAQEQQQPETEESNGKMEPQSNAAVEEDSRAKIDTNTKENTKPLSSPSSALEDFPSKFLSSSLLKKRPSSILRTSVKNPNSGKRRASVSFADENGGIISEQQTISVSPSKLSRRVRRGRALPSAYEHENEEEEEKVQKGLMGRVLVLLMDPPTKQYELTSLPYPLVSNENGIIGPTPLNILLSLVAKSASYEPLKQKTYTAFMRPDDKEAMNNALNILDYKFVKDEVLIAIPEGFGAEECSKFSKPILLDKRLVRLLKKLKKHERKAEKKRRLKTLSMKPSRFEQLADGTYAERNALGMGTGSGTDAEEKDGMIPSEERRRGGNGGIGIKWSSSLVSIILIVLLACMSAGSLSVFQQKKINEEVLYSQSMERNKDLCGKGAFCKPFGVKPDSQKQNKSVLMGRLREGIRKWNLEDDLML